MKERDSGEVRLDSVGEQVAETLLHYMYTGKVTFTDDNARPLVSAADFLLIQSLKELGSQFLEASLTPSNCFELRGFAEKFSCVELASAAMAFIEKNFIAASQAEEFKAIDYNLLANILSRDELFVNGEEEVYEAVVTWVKHSPAIRREFFEDLFSRVRLFSIPKHFLINHIDSEDMVKDSFICTRQLLDALKWHIANDCGEDRKPRKCLQKFVNVIALCGGNRSREVMCFCPDTHSWCYLANMLVPRDEHVATTWDNHVYAFGGTQQENGHAAEKYDHRIDSWTAVANMPGPRSASSAVTCGDRIYVIGGRIGSGGATNQVIRYDPAINRWSQAPPMQCTRAGLCAVAWGECIYVMGGLNHSNEFLNSAERYKPRTKTWSRLAPMKATRYFASASLLNRKIFVVGGQSSNGGHLSSVETYDPTADEWSAVGSICVARQAAGLARLGNRLFLFGGYNNSGSLDSVECYGERTKDWQVVAKMPFRRAWVQCQVLRVAAEMVEISMELDLDGGARQAWASCLTPRGIRFFAVRSPRFWVSGYCTKWRIQGSFDSSYPACWTSKPSQEAQYT